MDFEIRLLTNASKIDIKLDGSGKIHIIRIYKGSKLLMVCNSVRPFGLALHLVLAIGSRTQLTNIMEYLKRAPI